MDDDEIVVRHLILIPGSRTRVMMYLDDACCYVKRSTAKNHFLSFFLSFANSFSTKRFPLTTSLNLVRRMHQTLDIDLPRSYHPKAVLVRPRADMAFVQS